MMNNSFSESGAPPDPASGISYSRKPPCENLGCAPDMESCTLYHRLQSKLLWFSTIISFSCMNQFFYNGFNKIHKLGLNIKAWG